MASSAAEGGAASLAVYIKSRGLRSRLYMGAISPFRHAIIYPSLIARVEAAWRRSCSDERGAQPAGRLREA